MEPFALYIANRSPLGVALEGRVFLEAFGNTPKMLRDEYGPYEEASRFIVVIDHKRARAAGVIRLIAPGPAGLKLTNDFPDIKVPEGAWEIATLAVAPEYRNIGLGLVTVTQGLVMGLVQVGLRLGDIAVAMLDLPVFRMLQATIGHPFVQIAPTRPYLGSRASIPVQTSLTAWQHRLEDPFMYSLLFHGEGLEGVLSTPDWDLAAKGILP